MAQPAERPVWEVVCATGPRPWRLDRNAHAWTRDKLLRAACWLRDQRGTRVGISGMQAGVDLWWADAVVQAGLVLGAYVPYPQQTELWRKAADRAEWQRLIELADPRYSKTFATEPSVKALFARNTGMIDDSAAVLAVWNPARREGGTWDAVQKTFDRRKPVVHLNPAGEGTVSLRLPDIRQVSTCA